MGQNRENNPSPTRAPGAFTREDRYQGLQSLPKASLEIAQLPKVDPQIKAIAAEVALAYNEEALKLAYPILRSSTDKPFDNAKAFRLENIDDAVIDSRGNVQQEKLRGIVNQFLLNEHYIKTYGGEGAQKFREAVAAAEPHGGIDRIVTAAIKYRPELFISTEQRSQLAVKKTFEFLENSKIEKPIGLQVGAKEDWDKTMESLLSDDQQRGKFIQQTKEAMVALRTQAMFKDRANGLGRYLEFKDSFDRLTAPPKGVAIKARPIPQAVLDALPEGVRDKISADVKQRTENMSATVKLHTQLRNDPEARALLLGMVPKEVGGQAGPHTWTGKQLEQGLANERAFRFAYMGHIATLARAEYAALNAGKVDEVYLPKGISLPDNPAILQNRGGAIENYASEKFDLWDKQVRAITEKKYGQEIKLWDLARAIAAEK